MIKNVSELRHKIQIVRVVSHRANGAMVTTDVKVAECLAAVQDAGNREFYAAAASHYEDIVNFTIRWMEGVSPGMVVLYAGRRHAVVQVNRLSHQGRYMVIKTGRRAVADG